MDVEESFDALFNNCNTENTEWLISFAKKCIATSPGEKEVLRALQICLCYGLEKFHIEDIEEEVFRVACPAAKNFVAEKLSYLEENPRSCPDCFNTLLQILSYFERVYEYLKQIQLVSFIDVKSLLISTCEILLGCFSHCKRSEDVYGSLFNSLTECLSNFFKKCCDLQERFLSILTDKLGFDAEDDREILLLDEVMKFLSKLGIVFINLEVKTMAKVWKTFASLLEMHLSSLEVNFNMGETIKDICESVTSNVETVLARDGQELNKIIKLSCFLIKLVIKFSEIFIKSLRDCQSSLLNLLLMLCKYDGLIGTEEKFTRNQDLISQLTITANPLLSVLITDVKFIKECETMSKENKKPVEFCVFCCLILKKLKDSIGATRSLWFNKNENILDWIFISASSSLFLHSNVSLPGILINGKQKKFIDLYEYVLVTTSTFMMTASADEYCLLEEKLIENVLQTNPVRALLAIDIWCLLARFADSELCFAQIQTLAKLFQELQTLRVEKCYLGSLIRRLFPLLTASHRSLFLKSFKPSFYSEVWEGTRVDGLAENEVCDVRQPLMAEVDSLLDQDGVEVHCDVRVLMGRRNITYDKFGGKVSKLWKFNCDVLPSTNQSLRFLKTVSTLTACVVSGMPPEDLFMVLTQMKKLLALGQPTSVKLSFLWILNSLSTVRIPAGNLQRKIVTSIAETFRDLLSSSQVLVKQKALETFFSFSHVTSHGEIVPLTVLNAPELKLEVTNYFKNEFPDDTGFCLNEYLRELYRLKFRHVCPVPESSGGEFPAKKARRGPNNVQETVGRWKEDSKVIADCFHSLPESQKREIKNICNRFLSLTF